MSQGNRRDPFAQAAAAAEPAADLVTGILSPGAVAALNRPGRSGARRTPIRPAEKRRRNRKLTVTFSIENADVPERLRALAERWGLFAPDGRSPNVSGLIEHLLLPQLEAAERGEVNPPEE